MIDLDESELGDEPFIFRLNDNGTGPSLLVKVCMERGWRGYHHACSSEERWNLWWRNGSFPTAHQKNLQNWQFTNHIPKGGSICRKDNLSRLLRCMRKIYGSIYDFSPAGFHLPLEYAKLASECSRSRRRADCEPSQAVWICKPVAQSQGRGIFLFRSLCELSCAHNAIVQRYIERPLLIAGYKFDLRLYVCVPCYRPLTAYMYAEGLARFGTDKYTLNDLHNPYRHLTNSSLNKSGPRYAECKDRIGSGCKWTLKQLRRHLWGSRGAGGAGGPARDWLAWQRVRALVALTLLAQAPGVPRVRNCFEFFGFDVLLDENLKPWLLEVNLSPALAYDCEADALVKRPMLHELFDLLGLPMRHTGLGLYAAAARPPSEGQSSSSDEENAAGGGAPPAGAGRAPGAWRRRRAHLPLKALTLRPPSPPRQPTPPAKHRYVSTQSTASDGAARVTRRPLGVVSATNTNVQKDKEPNVRKASPPEEEAPRRRAPAAAPRWGNGVDWARAPARVGHWVRIFPHDVDKMGEEGSECDVRAGVAAVARFARAAREVAREAAHGEGDCESDLEVALRRRLEHHIELWLPPR